MPLTSDSLYPSRLPPRIPLLPSFDSRSGSPAVDAKLVNGFMEKDQEGNWHVVKRPGLIPQIEDAAVTGSGLGLYYWEFVSSHFTITSDGLMRQNSASTVGLVDVTPAAPYDFNELLTSPRTLFFKNSRNGYTLTSTGILTEITSVDYPGATYPLVPGSASLNGTIYVMTFDGQIFGSAIGDALTWDPLNMIRAQIEPDSGVALAKQASYVVAFKSWTTEFFYDAGAYNGTLTGSPLLPVANAKLPMGCANASTVQSIDDTLFFEGRNKTIGPGIYSITGAKLGKVSTAAVDKLLALYGTNYSWYARVLGHTFYVLRVEAPTPLSLVYDITSGVWQFWQEGISGLDVERSAPGLAANVNYLQGADGAVLRALDTATYYDTLGAGGIIPLVCESTTPNFDAGSSLGKVMSKLRILADRNSGGSLEISWSDDDYKTWSTWVAVNLQDDVPFLTNLGKFAKRAFRYRHSSPTPFRMEAFETDLLLCSI